jgi:hypothetical protein
MIPRLDILPAPQRALWPDLTEIPPDFVLYGGTALALRLGHRTSEDFDFFSNQSFQPDELERRLPFLAGSTRLQSSPNTLVSLVDRNGPVKVSFFGGLTLRRVQDPEAAVAVYGKAFNPILSLKALSYFADGDLSSLSDAIRSRLTEAVRKIDPDQIPEIQPRPGGTTP